MPGATVTIIVLGTQAAKTVTSDASGFFVQTNLLIGDYSVEISKGGFRGATPKILLLMALLNIERNLQRSRSVRPV